MRLYRLLLLTVLPPAFRREWGEAMVEEARLVLAEAGPRRRNGLEAWRRLVLDALRTGAREWAETLFTGRTTMGGGGWVLDLRLAFRGLRRHPGFAGAAVATLAVAIGVNATVFAAVDALLLRALPWHEPDRLVAPWPDRNWSREMMALAREELRTMEGVAGYGGALLTLTEGGDPAEIFASVVTTDLHQLLGAVPARGRTFTPDDGLPGAEPVVVLSHALWMERFGGDPAVVGGTVALGGDGAARRRVVGVMAAGYRPLQGPGVDAWIPVIMDPSASSWDGTYFMAGVARLAPGATVSEARTDLRRMARVLQERRPGYFSDEEVARADLVLLGDALAAEGRTPLLLAMAAVLLVLLVACANVANLVLARTLGRERELSVRRALGAGRGRTARLVLVETMVVGLGGGAVGLGVALAMREGVEGFAAGLLPFEGLSISPRVVLFTTLAALGAAAVAGIVPALAAAGRDPGRALGGGRGSTGDRRGARFQSALVVAQLALATTLVAGAGLLGRSLAGLTSVDPGFRPEGVLTFRLTAPADAYPDDADVLRFFREARASLEEVPGVESAGFVHRLPMGSGTSRITVQPEGMEIPEGARVPEATHRLVTPGYLETVGATPRAGEWLGEAHDREAETVAGVVNRTAAERFWPGESAVGRHFLGPGEERWIRVVGVVEDLKEDGPAAAPDPAVYILHRDWAVRTLYAVVRLRPGAEPSVSALERAVWAVGPTVPVTRVRTLESVVRDRTAVVRTLLVLAGILGGVALFLGSVGVYGVVAQAAGRRRAELGVRAALGAGRARLRRQEMTRSGRMVVAGVLLGVPGAWLAGRAMGSLLFGVTPLAPTVLVPVAAGLALVGLAAVWIPVVRASAVDPVEALRAE